MHLGAARRPGVLPGVERRERAVARAVVVALGRRPGRLPGGEETVAAPAAVLAADGRAPAGLPVRPAMPRAPRRRRPAAGRGRQACRRRGRTGRCTPRPRPATRSGRSPRRNRGAGPTGRCGSAGLPRRPGSGRSPRPARSGRRRRRLEPAAPQGVERERCVGVQVAEERLAEGVVVRARLPRDQIGRLRGRARRAPFLDDASCRRCRRLGGRRPACKRWRRGPRGRPRAVVVPSC